MVLKPFDPMASADLMEAADLAPRQFAAHIVDSVRRIARATQPREPTELDAEASARLVATVKEAAVKALEAAFKHAGALEAAPHTTGGVDAEVARAEELAAVSGRVDPIDLHPAELDEAARSELLRRLAPSFEVSVEGRTTLWTLAACRRTEVLGRLIRSGDLDRLLAGALPPTDLFGELLRRLLREGAALTVETLALDELLVLASAMEAINGLGYPGPPRVLVDHLIQKRKFDAERDVLLASGFVGRVTELASLDRFLDGASVGRRLWSGLTLTGLGGAGKSTLLAKFAREVTATARATLAVLDFDRPGVDAGDTYWLEMEMARQVAYQYVETAEDLQRVRTLARATRVDENKAMARSAHSSDVESSRGIMSGIRTSLAGVGASARPFALVLDTFEEVTQGELQGRILSWLDGIGEALHPTPLKVIFSGRFVAALPHDAVDTQVSLAELDPGLAQQLLERLGVANEVASRLAWSNVFPCRPLELKLLARLLNDPSAPSINELEEELAKGGPAVQGMFAALVYRRVLLRIREDLRPLAYPGLVLRFVTPELLQEVLVPALGLPEMTRAQAESALASLSRYEWLTYRGPNGEVWHRKDLRRSMLKVAIGKEPERAIRVHQRAIRFFRERAGDDRMRAEAIYHELMLLSSPSYGQQLELDELRAARSFIAADDADLPRPGAALLRLASGSPLSVDDVAMMPVGRHLETAYHGTGRAKTAEREFGAALEMYRRVREAGRSHSRIDRWETDTLFATASWPELAALQPTADTSLLPAAIVAPLTIAVGDELYRAARAESTDTASLAEMAAALVLLAPHDLAHVEILGERVRASPVAAAALPQNRVLLLDALVGRPGWWEAFLVSGHGMILRLDWLEALGQLTLNIDIYSLIRDTERIMSGGVRGRWTIKSCLHGVNSLRSELSVAAIALGVSNATPHPDLLVKMMRGPDPEFRDPCCFALLDAFGSPADWNALGAVFAETVPLRLDDLRPEAFATAVEVDPEHELANYVEIADRTGVLLPLLSRARSLRPSAAKLRDVTAAYDRWLHALDAAVRSSLNTPAPRNVQ